MKTLAATEAQNHFGELLDSAQQGPVTIHRKGEPVAVIMSVEDFERLQCFEEREGETRLAESLVDYRAGRTVSAESVHAEVRSRIEGHRGS